MQNNAVKLKENIYWVGVRHPQLRVFDVIMHTPYGTTYNAYVVKGSEGAAVIETAKEGFAEEYFTRLFSCIDASVIKYIVLNHTEPDHSGSLKQLLALAPQATVVCSRAAKGFLQEIMNQEFPAYVPKDFEELSLGDKTLTFISAPFLHWPDSMFTYVKEDAVLFSCDVFGAHYGATEAIFSDEVDGDDLMTARKYYFDVIFGPFKSYMLSAIEKIKDLPIALLAPSHGPMIREDCQKAIEFSKQWSQDVLLKNNPKSVFIGYVSCYGYTQKLAEAMAQVLAQKGIAVDLCDVSKISVADACEKAHRADGVLVGSPTINRDALAPVWQVLYSLSYYICKDKPAGAFGSFGWSGEAVSLLETRLKSLGFKVQENGIKCKLNPSDEALKETHDFAEKFFAML